MSSRVLCMNADVKPFTIQEAALCSTVWSAVSLIAVNTQQEVIDKLSTTEDPWSFVREDEAYKRLSVSPHAVKNAFLENLLRVFDTRLPSGPMPFPEPLKWKWIRIMIAVCAMVDAQVPETYHSDFGHNIATLSDVAQRQGDQLLVQLLNAQALKNAKM